MADEMGMQSGWALDLLNGWDFDKKKDRAAALKLLRESRLLLLVGSPMCTWFSSIINRQLHKMPREKIRREVKKAIRHVKFVCLLYEIQCQEGRYFLHEHPLRASSWKLGCIQRLVKKTGVNTTVADMCAIAAGASSDLREKSTYSFTRNQTNSPSGLIANGAKE